MRRRKAKKITVLPDPRFQDAQVTKFVNNLMYDGKKSLAFKIFYDAIDIVEKKIEDVSGLETFKKALENVAPPVEVRSRRVGGATFQIPTEIAPERRAAINHAEPGPDTPGYAWYFPEHLTDERGNNS